MHVTCSWEHSTGKQGRAAKVGSWRCISGRNLCHPVCCAMAQSDSCDPFSTLTQLRKRPASLQCIGHGCVSTLRVYTVTWPRALPAYCSFINPRGFCLDCSWSPISKHQLPSISSPAVCCAMQCLQHSPLAPESHCPQF